MDHMPADNFDEILSSSRFGQLILSAAGEGIYGVNADGKTIFVNPAAERMLGNRHQLNVGKAHVLDIRYEALGKLVIGEVAAVGAGPRPLQSGPWGQPAVVRCSIHSTQRRRSTTPAWAVRIQRR